MTLFNIIPHKLKCLLIETCVVFLLPLVALPQATLDDTIPKILKSSNSAGVSVAVLKNGLLTYSVNYGYANIGQNKAISDSTAFGIMSVSKNMIACAIMQLAVKNLIDLDASITKYVNTVPRSYNDIKVYQLLNHTSGVPDYVHVKRYMQQANRTQTPIALLTAVFNNLPEFKPGTKNSYSNSNYILLGLIIEKVSGKKLRDYLKQMIFDPLGMSHSYLDENLTVNLDKALGYTFQNDHLIVQPPLNPSQYWAAGGIVSTKQDLITYNKALRSGRLLPINVVKRMMQPIKLDNGAYSEYGFGFELMQTPELEIAGNTGAGLGYNAALLSFLKDDITIIVLTNTSNGKSALIAKQIHDLLVSNNGASDQPAKDNLDNLIFSVLKYAAKGIVEQSNFQNAESLEKFRQNNIAFIQQQGKLLKIENNGEKVNPKTIVRRYKITFDNSVTFWIVIFSKESKIIMTNHM